VIVKNKILIFALWVLALAGTAQAEYAYDCKVDWICHGPNLCETSEEAFSLALSDGHLYLEYGHADVEEIELIRVDGDIYDWSVFSGLDSDGNLTVLSLDSAGNVQLSTHRKTRGNSLFTSDNRILTSYLTCIWRP